jgi:antitoxin component YwqK of YwqJK toxin-antitoxin module
MKKLLFLLLLFITNIVWAQNSETYYDHQWKVCEPNQARYVSLVKQTDSGWRRLDYFAGNKRLQMSGLYKDNATKIANGWFVYYYANGVIEARGAMQDNKRQGLWLSYHLNGMMSDSTVYENGEPVGTSIGWHSNGFIEDSIVYTNNSAVKVFWFDDGTPAAAGRTTNGWEEGVWQYFHKNGLLAAKERYDVGKLVSRHYFDINGVEESDTTSKDRDAEFKGGKKGWDKFFYKRVYFPPNYKFSEGDAVTVYVTAVIDEEGNVTEPFVELPFHPAFDEIALSIFKQSPQWIPAIRHNRTVKQRVRQGITFRQGY